MVCGLVAVWVVGNRNHYGLVFGGKVCPQLRFLAYSKLKYNRLYKDNISILRS